MLPCQAVCNRNLLLKKQWLDAVMLFVSIMLCLGCAPFRCRYQLTDNPPDGLWSADLAALDSQESNFEIRADGFADLILTGLHAGATLSWMNAISALRDQACDGLDHLLCLPRDV